MGGLTAQHGPCAPKLSWSDWVIFGGGGEAVKTHPAQRGRGRGWERRKRLDWGPWRSFCGWNQICADPAAELGPASELNWLFSSVGKKPPATMTERFVGGRGRWRLRTIYHPAPGFPFNQEWLPSFLPACIRAGSFKNWEAGSWAVTEANHPIGAIRRQSTKEWMTQM